MLSHRTLRARALARPEVKAEFERLSPEFAFLDQILAARKAAGLTQAEIARPPNRDDSVRSSAARVGLRKAFPVTRDVAQVRDCRRLPRRNQVGQGHPAAQEVHRAGIGGTPLIAAH